MSFYRISSPAYEDLESIWAYIGLENDAPESADKLIDQFFEKFDLLEKHPQLGRSRDELAKNLRSIAIGSYILFYRPVENGVEVVRVLHGSRDFKRLF